MRDYTEEESRDERRWIKPVKVNFIHTLCTIFIAL